MKYGSKTKFKKYKKAGAIKRTNKEKQKSETWIRSDFLAESQNLKVHYKRIGKPFIRFYPASRLGLAVKIPLEIERHCRNINLGKARTKCIKR